MTRHRELLVYPVLAARPARDLPLHGHDDLGRPEVETLTGMTKSDLCTNSFISIINNRFNGEDD